MIRIVLPYHLRRLAEVDGEVTLEVDGPLTQRTILDALESRYPTFRGMIRDHVTHKRRPFLRFFACEQDLSHHPLRCSAAGSGRLRRRAFSNHWRDRGWVEVGF